MDKLLEHTLQKQVSALQGQVAELAALLKRKEPPGTTQTTQAAQAQTETAAVTNIGVQNTGSIRVSNTVVNQQITIRPWDGDDRITVPMSLITAAFTENPRLIEYCRLGDNARTDAETASPYVTEALVDLTRRAHTDPVLRNVYLNPKRADQVLVCLKTGSWEVRPLSEATRLMFDGVASSIHRAVLTVSERQQLPPDVQSAAAWVPILYEDEPDKYVKEGRTPMAAHLANTCPAPQEPGPGSVTKKMQAPLSPTP